MNVSIELSDWLLPGNTFSRTEAIVYATRFCVEHGFRTAQAALDYLKDWENRNFAYSSEEKQNINSV